MCVSSHILYALEVVQSDGRRTIIHFAHPQNKVSSLFVSAKLFFFFFVDWPRIQYPVLFALRNLFTSPGFCQVFSFTVSSNIFHSVPAALSPQVAPSATESCFARQHNISDNNNQCFSGANGHLPSQLVAQRPGAIDNQPMVTTEPMKARTSPSNCISRFLTNANMQPKSLVELFHKVKVQ